MAKRQTIQEKIDAIAALELAPFSPKITAQLRKALSSANNTLVAAASRITEKRNLEDLIPDLVTGFDRFMSNPLKTDRGCLAKTAIVRALNTLLFGDEALYLKGIRHIQMEPAWGPPVDTAPPVRVACLSALLRIGYPDLFFEIVQCLVDKTYPVRKAAIEALAAQGGETSELLLRFKCLISESDPDTSGDCFTALIQINPDKSLPFVARFIESDIPAVAEDAALAVGHSRTERGFELLRAQWENSIQHDFRRMLILPIAMTLCDPAFEFLLERLEDGSRDIAEAVAKAMTFYASSPERRQRILAAAGERRDSTIDAILEDL
jgi:HEAT repeat protein